MLHGRANSRYGSFGPCSMSATSRRTRRRIDARINTGNSVIRRSSTARRKAHDAQYHDPLPDAWNSRSNGANHRKDQIRVTVGGYYTAALSCLHEAPQMGAKGRMGGERGIRCQSFEIYQKSSRQVAYRARWPLSSTAAQTQASTCKAGSLTIRPKAKARLISRSPARFARGCTWSIRKRARCLGLTKISGEHSAG